MTLEARALKNWKDVPAEINLRRGRGDSAACLQHEQQGGTSRNGFRQSVVHRLGL
jgi:hypothetical protein